MAISLADKKLELRAGLVESIERLLEEAREGRIIDLVYAYADTEQEFFTGSSYERPLVALGLTSALHADVLKEALET